MSKTERPDQIKEITPPQAQAEAPPPVETEAEFEALVESKIGEIERSSQEVIEKAEQRLETTKGYYELSPEKIEEVSTKGGFHEKLNSIAEQIRTLAASTKEKILGVMGKKEEKRGEEISRKAMAAEEITETVYEPYEPKEEAGEEEVPEMSLEGIRGIRELISNPEAQELIQKRERALDEQFTKTEEEVKEINKEIETLGTFREALVADRIEIPLRERIDPERLRPAVEEHRMKLELYKRCADYRERRKRYETASDPITGRRLRKEQLEKIRPEFSNPINVIESTAPSLIKKAREVRYQVDKRYRAGVDTSFDETARNLDQFHETVKEDQEIFPEKVQNLERRAETLRFRFGSADSIEKRAALQEEWLAIQKEAEQQANNFQDSLDFVDLTLYAIWRNGRNQTGISTNCAK